MAKISSMLKSGVLFVLDKKQWQPESRGGGNLYSMGLGGAYSPVYLVTWFGRRGMRHEHTNRGFGW